MKTNEIIVYLTVLAACVYLLSRRKWPTKQRIGLVILDAIDEVERRTDATT